MESRDHTCAVCGVAFPADRLIEREGRAVCPRCWALEPPEPSTGSARLSRTARSGIAGERPGITAPVPGRGGPAPAAGGRNARGLLRRVDRDVRDWARGRTWWVRAPILLWLAWILVRAWNDPAYRTLWSGIDLAVHEIGHILWSPLGPMAGVAGGTLTQLLVPAVAGYVLLRQRDWFGVAVAIGWLGINCFEIVEYAGDAVARRLPLVSPTSAHPVHDWAFMLGRLGLLGHADAIARGWQWAGRIVLGGGVAFGAWTLWVMAAPGEGATGPGPGPDG